MDVKRDILDGPNLRPSSGECRLAGDKDLGEISNFNQGHDRMVAPAA